MILWNFSKTIVSKSNMKPNPAFYTPKLKCFMRNWRKTMPKSKLLFNYEKKENSTSKSWKYNYSKTGFPKRILKVSVTSTCSQKIISGPSWSRKKIKGQFKIGRLTDTNRFCRKYKYCKNCKKTMPRKLIIWKVRKNKPRKTMDFHRKN